ncbi:uncharacterized protein ISCGN_021439 [Ixodes scapularis]
MPIFVTSSDMNCKATKEAKSVLISFFVRLTKYDTSFSTLWEALKLLLLLSHGQASVERGFSVNKQMAVENLAEISYVSQRTICDAIKDHGGLLNIYCGRS